MLLFMKAKQFPDFQNDRFQIPAVFQCRYIFHIIWKGFRMKVDEYRLQNSAIFSKSYKNRDNNCDSFMEYM